jgi:hypothetical protein
VNLFLDASVVLAACGRATGASRALFDYAESNNWGLLTSPYVISEITANLSRLPNPAVASWQQLYTSLSVVRDVWTLDRPSIFGPAKDRPILFTAAAWSEVLLTLDRGDFGELMRTGFYGLTVLTPAAFLQRERAANRLCG